MISVAPSAFKATSAMVNNVLAYGGGGYGGAAAAVATGPEDGLDSLIGAGSGGAGIGLALADATLEGTKALPLIGNGVSVLTGAWDIYKAGSIYQTCAQTGKYN